MKYSAEVDNEKRNKSPRNDLLRNRRCVGIIQATKSTTQARFLLSTTTKDQSRCAQMPEPVIRGRFNEPRGVVRLRQRLRRKSVCFFRRSPSIQPRHPNSIFRGGGFVFSSGYVLLKKRLARTTRFKVAWYSLREKSSFHTTPLMGFLAAPAFCLPACPAL